MNQTRMWTAIGALALTTLLTASAAEAQERRIIVEGFRADDSSMSLQLNLAGLAIGDDAMDSDDVADLGGANVSWRWDLVPWGGLEVAFGGYGRASEEGTVDESRTSFSLAWLWYFARHYHHRFYGVTGFSGLTTQGSVGEYLYNYSESGLMLGVGSEWLVSRHWLISFDVRALLLSNDSDELNLPPEGVPDPTFVDATPAHIPAEWVNAPESRTAVMFNFGFGYRW